MIERRQKKHKRYIFYRLYVPVVYAGFFILFISWMISAANNREPSNIQIIGFILLFPSFGAAVLMIMSVFVFPFEFSIFGPLDRSHFPSEQPISKFIGTWGMVGIFRASIPFFNWYVYPSGLGISILGIGKVFIPSENIKELKEVKGFPTIFTTFFTSRYRLIHNSPEFHGPVYLPSRSLFETLKVFQP